MSKKDHDLLDTLKAAGLAIKWELGRFERRMMETAKRVVEEEVAKAIEDGRSVNALEISEVAVRAAKAQFVSGAGALPTAKPRRARIAKG